MRHTQRLTLALLLLPMPPPFLPSSSSSSSSNGAQGVGRHARTRRLARHQSCSTLPPLLQRTRTGTASTMGSPQRHLPSTPCSTLTPRRLMWPPTPASAPGLPSPPAPLPLPPALPALPQWQLRWRAWRSPVVAAPCPYFVKCPVAGVAARAGRQQQQQQQQQQRPHHSTGGVGRPWELPQPHAPMAAPALPALPALAVAQAAWRCPHALAHAGPPCQG